jgi:drug/metabolite transporter (DMT)-like permease
MWRSVLGAPGNVRGALWMALAALVFAMMNALIRRVGADIHGFEIAFFRSVFGVMFLAPIIASAGGLKVLKTAKPKLHAWRAVFGGSTMLLSFYAFTRLPLANATTLSFSQPLFLLALAPFLLGETVGWHRRIAAAVGFCGVLIAAQPGAAGFSVASVAMLAAALAMAFGMVCVKFLSRTDSSLSIMSWFSIAAVVFAFVPALLVWRTPTLAELALLVVMGALGTCGQYFYVRSYRVGEASVVAPFNFLQLPFAAGFGFLLFGETPGWSTLVGGVVIVASVLYIMRREAIVHRKVEPPLPPAE